jgi:hypothetical protein
MQQDCVHMIHDWRDVPSLTSPTPPAVAQAIHRTYQRGGATHDLALVVVLGAVAGALELVLSLRACTIARPTRDLHKNCCTAA